MENLTNKALIQKVNSEIKSTSNSIFILRKKQKVQFLGLMTLLILWQLKHVLVIDFIVNNEIIFVTGGLTVSLMSLTQIFKIYKQKERLKELYNQLLELKKNR